MLKLFIYPLMLTLMISSQVSAQTKDENSVSSAIEKLRKAMVDPEKNVLDQLTADGLSYGHSSGRVEGKASFIESLTSGTSDFVSIELSDQTVKVYDKTAIVRHTLSANTNDGGKPGTVKLAILLVWQKQSRQWKLLARQAVRL